MITSAADKNRDKMTENWTIQIVGKNTSKLFLFGYISRIPDRTFLSLRDCTYP